MEIIHQSLKKLLSGETLGKTESADLLCALMQEESEDVHIAAVLTAYRMRMPTALELAGFREALLSQAKIPVGLDNKSLDVCGTGGDGKNTINISTLSAIVCAACAVPVVKHGNYGSSSLCGSSNVLEHLHVPLALPEEHLGEVFRETDLAFLHAPYFHPAVRRVGAVRKSLGFRSVFNVLGPLVNPVQPEFHMLGVGDPDLFETLAELLEQEGKNFAVLHALDGYDEVSLTGPVRVRTKTLHATLHPEDFGFEQISSKELYAGDSVQGAAQRFLDILSPDSSDKAKTVVAANAGLGIALYRGQLDTPAQLRLASEEALHALHSGKALNVFECYRAHAQACVPIHRD